MKKLFLSSSFRYTWNDLKNWNESALKTGHEAHNILLNSTENEINSFRGKGVHLACYNVELNNSPPWSPHGPPHHKRFLAQYKYLMSLKNDYDLVVVTDSRDVLFASDPFPTIFKILNEKNKKIICGSECILYKDEHWGRGNLASGYPYVYEEYENQEICNVGVLCGEVQAVAELCLLIYTMCNHNPALVSDQSSFNVLMGTEFGKNLVHVSGLGDGLMVHLGTVGVQDFRDKLTEKPSWDESGIPMVGGKVVPIIHQYDRIDMSKWEIKP